jgi:hypothetical protein
MYIDKNGQKVMYVFCDIFIYIIFIVLFFYISPCFFHVVVNDVFLCLFIDQLVLFIQSKESNMKMTENLSGIMYFDIDT